jgi:hypothetical protein
MIKDINCEPPKIGCRSWKRKSPPIRKEPNELSNGSIASTLRLKIDFSDRVLTAAHHNGRCVQIDANDLA